jgi:hypothetical protein
MLSTASIKRARRRIKCNASGFVRAAKAWRSLAYAKGQVDAALVDEELELLVIVA